MIEFIIAPCSPIRLAACSLGVRIRITIIQLDPTSKASSLIIC
uniref:Uncharacterized protein n=1 Tax=Arundo donax TaxID=35708 RepID=A0A0A8YF43_ARUDO